METRGRGDAARRSSRPTGSTATSRRTPARKHMRKRPGFAVFGTTADMGIRARGRTLPRLFENAALGMFHIIGTAAEGPVRERRISARAESTELLLYAWLSELLYLHDAKGYFCTGFRSTTVVDNRLSSRIVYVRAGGARVERQVKAVTLHGLDIERGRSGYRVAVIFDL
ncbi:MAG: archease [Acidobacteriota bacterium]